MPTLDQIRAAIANKIQGVDAQIAVHDYERYTKQYSDLIAMYKAGDPAAPRLNGYHVRNVGTRETIVDSGRGSIWHRWRIRGFMSLDDADETEKLFDNQIEAIRDAFRIDDDLGKLVLTCIDDKSGEAGIQLLEQKPVMFAGVLCHSAELGLTTQHLILREFA